MFTAEFNLRLYDFSNEKTSEHKYNYEAKMTVVAAPMMTNM